MKTPYLDSIERTAPLVLEPVANGGWLVTERGDGYGMPRKLGAFSTAAEMLQALSAALLVLETATLDDDKPR